MNHSKIIFYIPPFILLLFLLLPPATLSAQTVKGAVYGTRSTGSREALSMATVYWLNSTQAANTDEHGRFSIDRPMNNSRLLIASFIGYVADTLEVSDLSKEITFNLKEQNVLDAAVVTGRQEGNYLSRIAPIRTEVISAAGLCKMACCNLAESFENSASVSVGYADAVTGARQIRLLGLSGIYTQMSDENRPTMRGLLTPFGLGFVPGQWLESIQIAKGPGSVVNGYEAITGQINMEYRKPTTENPLFVNLFFANSLRSEANIASSLQLNRKWSTVLLGHFSTDPKPHDGNHDGFLDEPLTFQYNFANRWMYLADNGAQWRFGFRALHETREAGQSDHAFIAPQDISSYCAFIPLWKSNIKNQGINLYSKVGIPLKKPGTETSAVSPNVAFVVDYTYHALDSYFGMLDKSYNAVENSLFANLMLQFGIGEAHRFNLGLSGHYDKIDEDLSKLFTHNPNVITPAYYFSPLGRKEHAWGAYGEYTLHGADKFLFVLGSRLDYNNLYGWLFSPRANIKYDFTENLIFRASGGKGYRTPNLIADNMGILSTGRYLRFDPNLDMEQAWTYGLNLTGYFPLGYGERSSLSFDYFRTDFKKQVLIDQERDPDYVWFYNLDGPSFTNTFQVDLMLEPIERFSILTTFRHTDARVHLHGQGTVERPLMSKYKGVLNMQYATRMNIWTFDATAQINGPSRLPNFVQGDYSPVYPMFYAQITRKLRDLDIYIGCENLLNYRQPHPIIDAENPFSRDFNATVIWGPLMGRKVYAGLRFTLWK
ncbi:MAG: TonB-dependent receptor [Bacteroidales bacterium]|nr:TonB-dependent receptor [Bacteroidales bacterium]